MIAIFDSCYVLLHVMLKTVWGPSINSHNETLFREFVLKLAMRAHYCCIYKLAIELEHNLKLALSHTTLFGR